MVGTSFDKLKELLEKSKTPVIDNVVKKEEEKFDQLNFYLSKEKKIFDELAKQISVVGKSQSIISCDSSNNQDLLIGLIKFAFYEKKIPILVLTSTNYKQILKIFLENKVDPKSVFIIDTVSKNISKVTETENIFFIDSLRNLTQLQIKLLKLFEKQKSKENDLFFIFDSVDVLSLYHEDQVLFKFVYSLTKLLHKYSVPGFFLSSNKVLLPKLTQFFDDFIELDKM